MSTSKSLEALRRYLKNTTPEQFKNAWDSTYIPDVNYDEMPTIDLSSDFSDIDTFNSYPNDYLIENIQTNYSAANYDYAQAA